MGRGRSRKGLFRSVQSWEKGPKPTSAPNPHRSSTQYHFYCNPALVRIWVARVVPVFHTADWSFYPRFLLCSHATAPCPTPRAMTPRRLWGWLKAEGQSCITLMLIRCITAAYDGPQHTLSLSILLIDCRERVGSSVVGTGWNLCFIRRLVQNSCFIRGINSR